MTRGRLKALALTVAVVIAAAAYGLPRARHWAEGRLRRALEERATALLGGTVRIEGLAIELVPPEIHIKSIEAERHGNRGSEATATAGRVTVRASALTFLRAGRGPLTVTVDRPRLKVLLVEGRALDLTGLFGAARGPSRPPGPGGQDGAPAPGGPSGPGSLPGPGGPSGPEGPSRDAPSVLAAIPAGSLLEVREGVMEFEVAGGLRGRLAGFQLDARPGEGGGLLGHASFSAGEYRGPGGEWKGLGGDAAFAASGAEVRFDPLSIRADGISLSGRAALRQGAAPILQGSLEAAIDIDRMARFFPEGAAPAGQLSASLEGSVGGGSLQARGNLEVENCSLWGVSVGALRSDVLIDENVHLRGIRAHLLGGEATGTADANFTQGRFQAEADLRIDGVDVAQILEHAGWTGPPLSGTIHYSGRHRIDGGGLDSLRGSGVLDAVGHYRSPRGEDLPLEVTSDLVTEGGTLLLTNGSLRAGSTRAGFSGTVAAGAGIRLKLKGGTGNLAEIVPLFAAPGKRPPPPKERTPGGGGATMSLMLPPHGGAQSVVKHVQLFDTARFATNGLEPYRDRPNFNGFLSFRRSHHTLRATMGRAPAVFAAARPAAAHRANPPHAVEESPLERIIRLLGGRWEWDGDLGYGKGGLAFNGSLRGFGLTYRGAPIGSLRAGVVYRDGSLSVAAGELRLDETSFVDLGGRVEFRGEGSVAIEADATNFPLEPVLAAIGIPAPVRGRLSGSFVISGRPDALAGRATVEASPFVVAGVEFDRLQGDLTFTPELLELRSVTLSQGEGRLAVEGRIPYVQGDWLPEIGGTPPGLSLSGRGLDLSLGPKAARVLELRGTASLEGRIEGALAAPRGSITVQAAGVEVDPTRVKALTAALEGVNIDQAIATVAATPVAAPAAAPAAEKKEEKKEEKKKEEEKVSEEEAAAGLGALFG